MQKGTELTSVPFLPFNFPEIKISAIHLFLALYYLLGYINNSGIEKHDTLDFLYT